MNDPDPTFNKWVSRSRSIASLTLGTIIVIEQTFFTDSAQPILIGLGALLLGLPLTRVLDKLVP